MNALLRTVPFDRLRLPHGAARSHQPKLLVLCQQPDPPSADSGRVVIHWAITGTSDHDEAGLICDGDSAAFARLAQFSQQYICVLLLGPTAASHFHLAAPKGLRQREWPLLIEDQLCIDDEMELAALQQGRDHLELVVTGRERLLAWQHWLSARGIRTTHWASVFMAQPSPASANDASVVADTHHLMIKTLAEPPAPHAPATERWLAWPRDWQDHLPAAIREKTWHWPWQDIDDAADTASLTLLQRYARHLPTTLPAMPGIKSSSRSLGHAQLLPSLSRTTRRMTAVIATLALLHAGAAIWQGYLDQSAQANDTQARLEGLLPESAGTPSLQRVQDRHAALHSLQQRNQWLTTKLESIEQQTHSLALKLDELSVNGKELNLRWHVEGEAAIEGPEFAERLAGLGRAEWQPETQHLLLHVTLAEETRS